MHSPGRKIDTVIPKEEFLKWVEIFKQDGPHGEKACPLNEDDVEFFLIDEINAFNIAEYMQSRYYNHQRELKQIVLTIPRAERLTSPDPLIRRIAEQIERDV